MVTPKCVRATKTCARVKRHLDRRRDEAIAFLGGVCLRCGFSDPRALQIDHINSDGGEERRRFKHSRSKLFREVLAGKPHYQLLCANCNQIKKHEKSEWHRKRMLR